MCCAVQWLLVSGAVMTKGILVMCLGRLGNQSHSVFVRVGVMAIRKNIATGAMGLKNCIKSCLGPLALHTYYVLSRPAPKAIQKTTIWYACSCFWAGGHPQEGQLISYSKASVLALSHFKSQDAY